jgi:Protein of unknown function (DUF3017)
MANRPADAGSNMVGPNAAGAAGTGSNSVGPNWAPAGAGAPPSIHHQDFPRAAGTAPGPLTAAAEDAARTANPGGFARGLAWLPYLIVLAGTAAGLYVTWQGSRHAARGTELVGCSLLVAAAFRLVLPSRYTAPMSSRGKTSDVLTFALFGAGVLVVALLLP